MAPYGTEDAHSPGEPRPPAASPRVLALSFLGLFLAASTVTGSASPAQAAVSHGVRAVAVAASKRGAPYAYGAAGPKRFDCSGLTFYAFRKAGRRLPRTAEQQYEQTRHIPPVQRAPGDLVFFPRGATMGHVGIYAGGGKIWHAPRPGGRVRLDRIWTSDVRYGRAG
ncbi:MULTISPECIES: C40 family peptidase [unclassified Streptomyces]|uniref:C40 family peptidase n=1 Tax=unclassified Streptomyces TaxID=2593676 RepID=UPI002E378138|nr:MULTISPECIES: C40 family peptidase [unclassified Streptomyces]WUC67844.1 C40 family peptidase [Streptomyces sp. NBC_00539]